MRFVLSIPSLLSFFAAMVLAPLSLAQQLEQRGGGRDYRERHEGAGTVLPVRQGEGAQETVLRGGESSPAGALPHRGRMTPEERRQLRRDIDDAGREIYRRHHGGHP